MYKQLTLELKAAAAHYKYCMVCES